MNDAMNGAINNAIKDATKGTTRGGMSAQVFRSGKPVTARGIVNAVIAGDVSSDEAVEMIEWLVEVRTRDTNLQDAKPARVVRPARRQT